MADVGIDGQIEYVNSEGNATGRMIAVQIKSGPSYLKGDAENWVFYPEEKHRFYWERFPLPVLIILHDPDSGKSYWLDIRHELRTASSEDKAVPIPKSNILQDTPPDILFEGFAVLNQPFMELGDVLTHLVRTSCPNGSFPVSYFDLFCNGLTNICRSLYFGMDVAMTVAETKLATSNCPVGVGLGPREHEFLFGYVQFLVHQHIADIDYSDCLIDWYDRKMQPSFMAPLTSRGRLLVDTIQQLQAQLQQSGQLPDFGILRAAQEDFVQMVFAPSHYKRISIIEKVATAYKNAASYAA